MILIKINNAITKLTNFISNFPEKFCKSLSHLSFTYSYLELLCTNNFLKKLLKKAIAICIPIAFYFTIVLYISIYNYSNAHAKGDLA